MTENDILHIAERISDRLYHEGILEWDNSGTSFDSFSKEEIVNLVADILSAEINVDSRI